MTLSNLGVRTMLIACAGLALSIADVARAGAPAQPAASGARAAAPAANADELMPIRRITLYRSGVGMFQREGFVSGDAEVSLRFSTDQINDILKSLVLLDLDGGRVESVSYSSKDPIERRLASFGVDLSDTPSASVLLSRLRGSPVKLITAEGPVSGTIMNVEERPTVIGGGPNQPATLVKLPWINLVTDAGGGGVKSVNLTTVTGFELLDKKLADELAKALSALAEYRTDNVKSVDFKLSGPDQARRVVAAYVHETPVWKNSYRLVLGDSGGGGGDPKKQVGALQGWAIVENTTDADWTNVRLSLVAGRPVSFQMDLYEPLYMQRPMIPVPMIAAAMPRAYQAMANIALQAEVAKSAGRELRRGRAPGSPPMPMDAVAAASEQAEERSAGFGAISAADLADYSPGSMAQAGQAGETFFYEVKTPITIERQRSAMIPFLTTNLPARRVSIFSLSDRTEHPMRGVEITNPADGPPASRIQLLPGPISVFEGDSTTSAYAGDAQIGNIPAGDKRLLAYAVDLDVAVLVTPGGDTRVMKLRIVDGMIEQTYVRRDSMTYGFRNKDLVKGRTLIVEHPRLADWALVEPKEPSEKTASFYRFELELKPNDEPRALTVTQERTERQRIEVSTFDLPTIISFHKDGKLSDAVLEAFKTIAGKRAAIGQSERALAQIDAKVRTIAEDQSRIRQNMQTIDRTTELYKRYATKLNEQETELEKLNAERASAQKQFDERRADLDAYVRGLDIE